jgi:hypothetical protein
MKNYLLFATASIFAGATLFMSCNQKELADSNTSKDSLSAVVTDRDSVINEFISSFNDIERNLDSVAIRQHLLLASTDKPGEFKPNQTARINTEIEAINSLMDQNRKKIAELNRKLKNSGNKNVQLEKTIATRTDQLAQKDLELASLNEKLNNLSTQVVQLQSSVTTLTEEGNAKTQAINDATTALHTAYYVVGKTKELEDSKLIDRKVGLLGMGKTSRLSGDFDNSKFTKIDYTQTNTIPVNSEMKIITSHPTDSYTLDRDAKDKDKVKNIVITNPEKFWSTSKYLVVVKS